MKTRVTMLVAGLLLTGCVTGGPVEVDPGARAAELLQGTWVSDRGETAGTPVWLFIQQIDGSTVRGEEWGFQDAKRWEPFTGTINQGELRIELRQVRQTLLLRPFDPGDGEIELRGRMATSPTGESPIRLKRQR